MAIDFGALLTPEQKQDLLTQRINQFAAEAYQHELNRQIAVNVNDAQAIEQAETALATLETAIDVHQVELNGLS
jgi:Spy/CpxP family protein refolding chaperone